MRALRTVPVDVTPVDRVNHHLFQALLYQVATGILSEGAIAPALRSMFRHQPSVRMLLAEVTDIDLAARIVRARVPDGDDLALGYDTRSSRPARPTATSATASGPRRPSG